MAGAGVPYIAAQTFAGGVYSVLTYDSLNGIGDLIDKESNINLHNPSSALSTAGSLTWEVGPSLTGNEYVGAFSDAAQFAGLLGRTLGSAATNLFSNSVQARTSTVNTFDAAIAGSGSGGGGSQPSNNSLWVTPSGAVVNWGGQLVSAPPSKK